MRGKVRPRPDGKNRAVARLAGRPAADRRAIGANCSELWNTVVAMTSQVPRTSLPDQVFRRLVADVLSGRYAARERLPTQRALAAELGVNLASVREGVKRLEQLRLVDTRHGDGMRVCDWRAQGGLDVLVHAVAHGGALDAALLREVFEARRLLLAEAAALAAARRSPEQAALLARLAREIAAATGDETAQGLDFAFMATTIEAAGNLAFSLIANSIRDVYLQRLDLFRAIVTRREELDYAAVAAAIGAHDGTTARAAMAALAAAQEQRLLEALR
jgi:GntR family transcriptional regulator, transcriptional repressor for pyruvate dehydrogenase complex